jgi:hypothetical protein
MPTGKRPTDALVPLGGHLPALADLRRSGRYISRTGGLEM